MLGGIYVSANAQSGTNSPYSQYGLGVLSDQSQGFNRGMNGLALGLRYSDQVNMLNPASYSAVDSLTMIMDVGLSGQITNFEENGKKINANNADFEYAVALFRLMPKVGLSIGVVPFTNIGYNYSSKYNIGSSEESVLTTSTEMHSGSGGFHQAYVGFGWNAFKGLSVGANFSYFWGTYDKSISVVNSDSYVNSIVKTYSTSVSNYKIDLGLQWQQRMSADNYLTVGATYGIGHKLGADVEAVISNTNTQTNVSDKTTEIVKNGLSLPTTFGVGMSWRHSNKWSAGVDYTFQKWGNLDFPEYDASTGKYVMKSGLLKDRNKLTIGGEWVPNAMSSKFYKRVHYIEGASYATPYIMVNGHDGPKEYSASVGFGLPLNRSVLNISGQWVRSEASGLIKENTFRINIGLTFNERWFMKWKVE